jgi:hypothetical protein
MHTFTFCANTPPLQQVRCFMRPAQASIHDVGSPNHETGMLSGRLACSNTAPTQHKTLASIWVASPCRPDPPRTAGTPTKHAEYTAGVCGNMCKGLARPTSLSCRHKGTNHVVGLWVRLTNSSLLTQHGSAQQPAQLRKSSLHAQDHPMSAVSSTLCGVVCSY